MEEVTSTIHHERQERLARYHPDTIAKRRKQTKAEKERQKVVERVAALAEKERRLKARIQLILERQNKKASE